MNTHEFFHLSLVRKEQRKSSFPKKNEQVIIAMFCDFSCYQLDE